MRAAAVSGIRLGVVAVLALSLWRLDVPSQGPLQSDSAWSPRLILQVVDGSSGKPTAARFTVSVDGIRHEPRWLGPHGLRFASVHVAKRQSEVITYARGTGPVWVPLTPEAKSVRVDVAKGMDYLPTSAEASVTGEEVEITITLGRWNGLRERGWHAADAHLHYDRFEPAGDRDWRAMMAGDDIAHSQFMVLKGGMVPGVWAEQFAYGEAGEAVGNGRTIVAGEEYRDRLQGHLVLFGLREVIPPMMTGVPESPHNYPFFNDVLERAHNLGALAGAAHGGTLGGSPTVLLDTILGTVDFMEIANWVWGFWPLDNWYRLMNCGYVLPPTAGTDLPNNPHREPWQPFLGGMRMYAKTGGQTGSQAWNRAIKRGETFVTNGPSIELDVNGIGPGGRLCLPPGGGDVKARIRMRGPRELRQVDLIRNGEVVASSMEAGRDRSVHEINLETALRIEKSAWLAASGKGDTNAIPSGTEMAHTSAVQVIVAGEPIWSESEARALVARLEEQKRFYAKNGRYATEEHRRQMSRLFDRAVAELRGRLGAQGRPRTSGCAE